MRTVHPAEPRSNNGSIAQLGAGGPRPGREILGRLGSMIVRLARNAAEVEAAQRLRFRVFFGDQANLDRKVSATQGLDADRYDEACDHLLVIDTDLPGSECERIVGTYRLLDQDAAARTGGFYSQSEFDFSRLLARHPGRRFLELGRSCVMPRYRSRRTIELLWQGVWAYVKARGIGAMAGCASFTGTIPAAHALSLAWLHHYGRASDGWAVRAHADRYQSMDLVPSEALDGRLAVAGMPALIKGYLRLGAKVGDGCVIDEDFGTVDVFIILPVEQITARYVTHYDSHDRWRAA